jgi:hypothetical protein
MEEEWRTVSICNTYEVSNFGRVRNRKTGKIKATCLAGGHNGNKYKEVHLWTSKTNRIHASVHRLVAIAFIPNPKNKPEVNHFDMNHMNNYVDNLEWVTAQENSMHREFMKAYTDPEDIIKSRECLEHHCPHHMKIEPYGYCSINQHKEWVSKIYERKAVSS